jgi:hypothetical protein
MLRQVCAHQSRLCHERKALVKNPIDTEKARERMAQRLRRAVTDAEKAGLVLVTDADAIGVRVLTVREREANSDLRTVGELVMFRAGCGGGHAVVRGDACNYGVS